MNIEQLKVWKEFVLKTTDWTQLNDAPLTTSEVQEWATFRQEVRDIPEVETTEEGTFPVPPYEIAAIPVSFYTRKPKETI